MSDPSDTDTAEIVQLDIEFRNLVTQFFQHTNDTINTHNATFAAHSTTLKSHSEALKYQQITIVIAVITAFVAIALSVSVHCRNQKESTAISEPEEITAETIVTNIKHDARVFAPVAILFDSSDLASASRAMPFAFSASARANSAISFAFAASATYLAESVLDLRSSLVCFSCCCIASRCCRSCLIRSRAFIFNLSHLGVRVIFSDTHFTPFGEGVSTLTKGGVL